MHNDLENKYLLSAFNAFNRKILIISPDFKILTVKGINIGVQDYDDLKGEICYQVFASRLSPCAHCPASKVLTTRKPAFQDVLYNSTRPWEMSCFFSYPILAGDEIDAIVMMDFDLPVQGLLEGALQQSNLLLRNLILSSVNGVIAVDKAGQILMFNEAASNILGYRIDEAVNHLNVRDIYPENGAYEVMERLRGDDWGGCGKLKAYQVYVRKKSGDIIPISLDAAIVYEKGREVATIGYFHDLSESLRIKRELEKTQIQLLQAEKMSSLGKLSAGVAHQLNNPLGGIVLFAKLMLEEYDLPDKARQDLDRILKDAERCRDTVKELLEFTRQTRQHMQEHDLNRAINRTLFLLESQTLFQNIEIEKKLDSSLPLVPCYIQQMNHLVMNIVLNAVDAMEGKGKLMVETALSFQKDKIYIRISDTGPGIPDHVLPHIFEPFFTTKEARKGTGLGLSIVYNIVENHNGYVVACSDKKGTTVSIELPLKKLEKEKSKIGN
ncbi:MAG: ATP-binding protein [Pseudomonadota bacterium]